MGMLDLFRRWLEQRSTRSRTRRRTGLFRAEQLESRQVLSAVVVGTTLNISAATTAPITVTQDTSGVHGTVDGTNYNFASNITVNAINVVGSSGNDQIEIKSIFNTTALNVNGGLGSNTLISDQTNVWQITGPNSGKLNGDTFSNIQNLTGSGFNDTFEFGASGFVSGVINGLGGVNSLDYSARTVGAGVTLLGPSSTFNGYDGHATAVGGGFSSINTLVGSADVTDTLIGMNAANVWTVSGGNSGNLDGQFFFSSVENLVGGTSSDAFDFGASGFISRTIDGGSGLNTLDYSQRSAGVETNLAFHTSTAIGSSFVRIGAFVGSSGADTIVGSNQANVWSITGTNSGSVGGLTYSSYDNLIGGTLNDSFVFAGGSVSGSLSGGGGTDSLDYSGVASPITVNLLTSTAPLIGSPFISIESFIGGTATNNTLIGTNVANTWNITGTNSGNLNSTYAFKSFQYLTGGTASDTFAFRSGSSISGATVGGAGTNTLDVSAFNAAATIDLNANNVTTPNPIVTPTSPKTLTVDQSFSNITNFIGAAPQAPGDTLIGTDAAANSVNNWDITGVNTGDLNSQITFSNIANLTGGLGSDLFHMFFGGQVTGTVNGSRAPIAGKVDTGNNWLDYSTYITPVAVNLTTGSATAIGKVTNIQDVHGGGGANTLTGDATGNILVGGASTDTITAGNGRSLLIGGLGADKLTGGTAQDIIIGGYTNYDNNFTALQSILAEWQLSATANTFTARIQAIRTGGAGTLNGANVLVANSTVHNDAAPDVINGGADANGLNPNWMWGGPAEIIGRTSQDVVDTPIDNPPILTGTDEVTYTAGQAAVAVDPNLTITTTVTTTTPTTLASATVRIGGGYSAGHDILSFASSTATGNIVGSFNATTGILTLTSANSTATVAQFQTALREVTYSNSSATPTTTPRSLAYQVYDGFSYSNSIGSLVFINFAPTLSGSSTVSYAPSQAATVINPTITVADANNAQLAYATVKISSYYQSSQDVLSFTSNPATTGNITGSFNSFTGVLTLTSGSTEATVAQYQAALRLVTYADVATFPLQVNRTVAFQVSDGTALSNVVNSVIAFAPILTGSNNLTYAFGQSATAIDPSIAATNPTGTTFTSATVQIGTGYSKSQDVLGFAGNSATGSIVGVFNSTTGTLTLTSTGAPATVAQYQAALRLVTFRSTASGQPQPTRVINYQVSTGNGASNIVQSTVTFA